LNASTHWIAINGSFCFRNDGRCPTMFYANTCALARTSETVSAYLIGVSNGRKNEGIKD